MPDKSNTCRRCKETKEAKHFYPQKRNVSGLENICKDCKRIERAAKRYHVSEIFVEHLYTFNKCMCCGACFKDRKDAHIHHTDKGVRGIVCRSCNYILCGETQQDRVRINKCLEYMASDNLLDTVNQQERPIDKAVVTESSETTRCETLYCRQCKRKGLTKKDFVKEKSRNYRRVCRKCSVENFKLTSKYKTLRESKTFCDCCGQKFSKTNKSCVHHIGTEVRGIICNRCNQVLRDETKTRRKQLLACLEFMI